MLIEFSVENYKSFRDCVTFSMVAANLKSKNKKLDENNIFHYKKNMDLVKVAAVYGANASGKSNLIQAFRFMRRFVINSSKESQAEEEIDVENYRLNTETEKLPSSFEVIFVVDDVRYRYGFELDRKKIHSEWLYRAKVRETILFMREDEKFSLKGTFSEGKGLESKTRKNALFLSVCAQWNGAISTDILKWFRSCVTISGLDDLEYKPLTIKMFEAQDIKEKILSFIREFDFGIYNLSMKNSPLTVRTAKSLQLKLLPEGALEYLSGEKLGTTVINTTHKKYDGKGRYAGDEVFNLEKNESEGTQKAFSFSGPLLDTLAKGKVLIVDELDARFHPIITQAIVQMFHDKNSNPKNAQLVFATHDLNLLDNRFFRRDQIWFTEKNKLGATDLYSLVEFTVRNDASFEKDYIDGKFGAVPFIGGIEKIFVENGNGDDGPDAKKEPEKSK